MPLEEQVIGINGGGPNWDRDGKGGKKRDNR